MDRRISFIKKEVAEDDLGFQVEVNNKIYTCWANILFLNTSKEFITNNSTSYYKEVVSFKVRKCKILNEVDNACKIEFNNKFYEIKAIDFNDNDYMTYKCEVVE